MSRPIFSSPSLPRLSPEEYVVGFQEGFSGVRAPENADARVRALFRERNDVAPKVADISTDVPSRVGVAGAGLMGVSIASTFLNARIGVALYDASREALETARERVYRELLVQRARRGNSLDDEKEERRYAQKLVDELLTPTSELDVLAADEFIVESIPEKLKLKTKFYRELESRATTKLVVLTNTSSLRVSDLSATLSDDENARVSKKRFCAFHFFHPVAKRDLLEIVPSSEASDETLARAVALARSVGKLPIVSGDGPGFLVNRLLQAYLNRSLQFLDAGLPPERLEEICLRMGMEAPPLRVVDEIGVDVAARAGWSFFKAFPERAQMTNSLPDLLTEGRLGRKTRRGFYRYESTTSWANDAVLDYRSPNVPNFADESDETIARAIFADVLTEGKLIIEEGIARTYREVDAGLVLALGFPRRLGGIFYFASASSELGDEVVERA